MHGQVGKLNSANPLDEDMSKTGVAVRSAGLTGPFLIDPRTLIPYKNSTYLLSLAPCASLNSAGKAVKAVEAVVYLHQV